MNSLSDNDSLRALYVARTNALVILFISIASTWAWFFKGHSTLWQWYLPVAIGFVFTATTMIVRRLSVISSGVMIFFCYAAACFASVVSSVQVSQVHIRNQPFHGLEVTGFVFAMIPLRPIWLGYFGIFLCGLFPILLYLTTFKTLRDQIPIEEPFVGIGFSVMSFFLYRHRIKSSKMERELAEAHAQEEILSRTAKSMLALRDLSNSPIQTLTATTALLSQERVPREEIARINKGALNRLSELSRILNAHEHLVDWTQFAGSFDPVKVLTEELESQRSKIKAKS